MLTWGSIFDIMCKSLKVQLLQYNSHSRATATPLQPSSLVASILHYWRHPYLFKYWWRTGWITLRTGWLQYCSNCQCSIWCCGGVLEHFFEKPGSSLFEPCLYGHFQLFSNCSGSYVRVWINWCYWKVATFWDAWMVWECYIAVAELFGKIRNRVQVL
jgi:hypothetical protein